MQVPQTESGPHNLVFVLVAAVRMHFSLQGGKCKCMGPEKRKRAFDSISPAGLVNAMSRFGIPCHFYFFLVVRGIYNGSTSWCEMRVLASTPSDLAFLQVVLYPASCFRSS